jgi:hypothetical protein
LFLYLQIVRSSGAENQLSTIFSQDKSGESGTCYFLISEACP